MTVIDHLAKMQTHCVTAAWAIVSKLGALLEQRDQRTQYSPSTRDKEKNGNEPATESMKRSCSTKIQHTHLVLSSARVENLHHRHKVAVMVIVSVADFVVLFVDAVAVVSVHALRTQSIRCTPAVLL